MTTAGKHFFKEKFESRRASTPFSRGEQHWYRRCVQSVCQLVKPVMPVSVKLLGLVSNVSLDSVKSSVSFFSSKK